MTIVIQHSETKQKTTKPISMKLTLNQIAIAVSLLATAQAVSAQAFLTDDFTVSANSNDPNFDIATGRQTGTQATSTYTTFGSQHQVGNNSTDVGQPGGTANSNFLLLAFTSAVQNNLNLNNTLMAGKPLTISFDMHVSGQGTFDPTDWVSFTLRPAGNAGPVAGSGFGMLVRDNGGVQMFNNGGNISGTGGFDTPGYSVSDSWSFTFSDMAGTGSPFSGNGTQFSFVNGANSGTFALGSEFGTLADLQVGFFNQNSVFGGIDNLSIVAVPEPSAMALACVGLLVCGYRYRRV